jgi:hypothetical protein
VDFSGRIEGLSDPLSLGCPDAVAREQLVDPEVWEAHRLAIRAERAYWIKRNHRYDPRDHTPPSPHSILVAGQRTELSFKKRCEAGILRGYGIAARPEGEFWEWIRPELWHALTGKNGCYRLQGGVTYVAVHFHDTQGVPLDQAAWAYASDKLLRSLKQYEKDGGATTDSLLHGSTVTILPETQALAIAKSQWPQLLRQAVAKLEEKIQAGQLERIGGLVRPKTPAASVPVPVLVQPSPEVKHRPVIAQARLDEVVERMLDEAAKIRTPIPEKDWFDFAKLHIPNLPRKRFEDAIYEPFKAEAKKRGLPLRGKGGVSLVEDDRKTNE